MTRFVLDCSVTLAWCFEDEFTAYANVVLDKFDSAAAIVPSIWCLEVANVLLIGERRKRLTKADTTRFLALLRAMSITVDQESPRRVMEDVLSLAREHNLSSYDAAYLELAMRHGCPLATLDAGLREASRKAGVTVLEK